MFDFTGTGAEVSHNLNAPRQVTFSAILYCLRCMVGHDVPLNQVRMNMHICIYICTENMSLVSLVAIAYL